MINILEMKIQSKIENGYNYLLLTKKIILTAVCCLFIVCCTGCGTQDSSIDKPQNKKSNIQQSEKTEEAETITMPVTFVNNTGVDIYYLYASSSDTDDWEEDILNLDVLETLSAFQVDFTYSSDQTKWDFAVKDLNDNMLEFYDMDFSDYGSNGATIVLNSDGTADIYEDAEAWEDSVQRASDVSSNENGGQTEENYEPNIELAGYYLGIGGSMPGKNDEIRVNMYSSPDSAEVGNISLVLYGDQYNGGSVMYETEISQISIDCYLGITDTGDEIRLDISYSEKREEYEIYVSINGKSTGEVFELYEKYES